MRREKKSDMPPIYHILLDGTRMNSEEFKEWCKTHTVPLTCPVYDALAEIKRERLCAER